MSFVNTTDKPTRTMQISPCAKINLGLNVVSRRSDGYHNLETVFYPVPLFDSLNIEPLPDGADSCLTVTGLRNANELGEAEKNLVMRAYRMLEKDFNLPPVHITLGKHIPMQAGLGGGSSDGAYTLRLLNSLFELGLTDEVLRGYAARLGADCPFFVTATPAYAEGIGDRLMPVPLSLQGWQLVIVKPPVAVSTREAYAGITPRKPLKCCRDVVMQPVNTWRGELVNDFEESIFALLPEIGAVKQRLYDLGAVYAVMSGSGSSVVGLFENSTNISTRLTDSMKEFEGCFTKVVNLPSAPPKEG